jgi:hypothetical protein
MDSDKKPGIYHGAYSLHSTDSVSTDSPLLNAVTPNAADFTKTSQHGDNARTGRSCAADRLL